MVLFELAIIVLALVFLLILYKIDNKVLRRFFLVFIGILLFQYFTQALWLTKNLEPWTYLYLGVNWIITIGRSTMVIVSMAIVDIYFSRYSEKIRFLLYLVLLTISGVFAEAMTVAQGNIQYHPALKEVFSGYTILGSVPVEALYYIPVFMMLVISFVRYWELALESKEKRKKKK